MKAAKSDMIIGQMDLDRGQKQQLAQYSQGLTDGIHMALVAVAQRLLAQGQDPQDIRRFLEGLAPVAELRTIIQEAQQTG